MDTEKIEKTGDPAAKALRWVANMLGGVEQEKGFSRTAAIYCQSGADLIESLQAQLAESQRRERAAVEDLHDAEPCYACKHAIDGEMCLCSECDIPEEDCNEKCPWFDDPCGRCMNYLHMKAAPDNWQWRGPQVAGKGEAE